MIRDVIVQQFSDPGRPYMPHGHACPECRRRRRTYRRARARVFCVRLLAVFSAVALLGVLEGISGGGPR